MSFLRPGEIYPFDEGGIPPRQDHALAHRNEEFPAGYSLVGCTPAEPASASPAGAHFQRNRRRSTIEFHRTANSVLTVCLTPGDNPKMLRSGVALSANSIFCWRDMGSVVMSMELGLVAGTLGGLGARGLSWGKGTRCGAHRRCENVLSKVLTRKRWAGLRSTAGR